MLWKMMEGDGRPQGPTSCPPPPADISGPSVRPTPRSRPCYPSCLPGPPKRTPLLPQVSAGPTSSPLSPLPGCAHSTGKLQGRTRQPPAAQTHPAACPARLNAHPCYPNCLPGPLLCSLLLSRYPDVLIASKLQGPTQQPPAAESPEARLNTTPLLHHCAPRPTTNPHPCYPGPPPG